MSTVTTQSGTAMSNERLQQMRDCAPPGWTVELNDYNNPSMRVRVENFDAKIEVSMEIEFRHGNWVVWTGRGYKGFLSPAAAVDYLRELAQKDLERAQMRLRALGWGG